MDKVIVTALLMIASITGAVIAMNGMIPAISKSTHALESANQAVVKRIVTDVEILAIAADADESYLEAWVKNVGAYSIGPVASVDVLLITPGEGYSFLNHDLAANPGSWREDPVGSGWQRGEILNLHMVLPEDFPTSERYHILRLSTPNGVIGEQAFERW